ncbi:hypothetical protein L596_008493 [Steinernema carpocapsae]|uniref:Nucleolar protein 6 n=1 Tax=Steinernema carpocapsae TaxID=34508 RepID=A0A4U5PCN3_STECR|nr:hypothetical protein L596_008493 [Steinernema carpocapsae]
MKRKAGKKANVVAKKKAKASIAEFNKSPFVLQCDDLLAENSFAASVVEESEKFAASIIKILRTGKLQGKHPLVDTKWMQESGVVFPLKIDQKLIERMKSSSLDFEFKKPQQAEIVGDWKSGAALKSLDPEILIDVQMSQEYFGPRDHLNFIYHVRRAHYASACAVILGKALKNATLSFVTNSDAPWNPDILVERSVEGTDVVPKTRITFSVSTEAPFALMSRLTSEKNCVRSSFVQGKVSKKEQDQDDVATPFYNRSIVMDLCWRNLRAKLTGFLNGNEVALKAYKLLKLWAARSDLFKRSDGISKETLAYLLVYLDQKQIISDKMELTTLLTNFWTWLVEKNFQEAISLKEDADIAIFEGASKYVFVDPEGHVNLVASMSVPALGRISREASRALRMLPRWIRSTTFSLLRCRSP